MVNTVIALMASVYATPVTLAPLAFNSSPAHLIALVTAYAMKGNALVILGIMEMPVNQDHIAQMIVLGMENVKPGYVYAMLAGSTQRTDPKPRKTAVWRLNAKMDVMIMVSVMLGDVSATLVQLGMLVSTKPMLQFCLAPTFVPDQTTGCAWMVLVFVMQILLVWIA